MGPPRWPDPAHLQQMHLDIRVGNAQPAEQELLGLSVTRVRGERETGRTAGSSGSCGQPTSIAHFAAQAQTQGATSTRV